LTERAINPGLVGAYVSAAISREEDIWQLRATRAQKLKLQNEKLQGML